MIRQMRKLLAAVGGTGVFVVLVILRSPFDTVYMLVQAIFFERAFRAVSCSDMAMLSDACIRFGNAALLVVLSVLPHVWLNQMLVARKAAALRKRSLEAAAENLSDMNLFIVCADTAKLYDACGFLGRRFQKSSRTLMRNNFKIHFRKALGNAMVPLFSLGGYLLLLYVGSGLIAAGRLDFGGLTALMQYRGGFLKGIFMLIACIVSMKEGLAGIRRVNETIDMGNSSKEN